MEIGNPPLYAQLNKVARDMDMSLLDSLGPFARTFKAVTSSADGERTEEDKIKTGYYQCCCKP